MTTSSNGIIYSFVFTPLVALSCFNTLRPRRNGPMIVCFTDAYMHHSDWMSWVLTLINPLIIERITTTKHMMTSSNGNSFRVTGHLCGELYLILLFVKSFALYIVIPLTGIWWSWHLPPFILSVKKLMWMDAYFCVCRQRFLFCSE